MPELRSESSQKRAQIVFVDQFQTQTKSSERPKCRITLPHISRLPLLRGYDVPVLCEDREPELAAEVTRPPRTLSGEGAPSLSETKVIWPEDVDSLEVDGIIWPDEVTSPLDDEDVEEMYDLLYDPEEFSIPPAHIKLVDSKKLTRNVLLQMEYIDILRLATYPPAKQIISNIIGVRGIHLKNYYRAPDGTIEKTEIKPHQLKTLTWMRHREELDPTASFGIRGGIAALDPGLGKTLTALLHTLSLPRGEFPTLIICSLTILKAWKDDINKFFSSIKVLFLHEIFMKKAIKSVTRDQLREYDIVITTYDVCKTACRKGEYHKECLEIGDEHSLMKDKIISVHERKLEQADRPDLIGEHVIYGTPWTRVISDESQTFANPTTKTYLYIMAIYGRYKWCTTGTPIRNYNTDIWAQLRFCGYNSITRTIEWKRKGDAVFVQQHLKDAIFSMDYKNAGVKLPPKTKYTRRIVLTGKHKRAYDYILGATRSVYDKMMQNLCSFSCVLAMFTRLRQCAIAPYLITAESKREKSKGAAAKGDKQALELIKKLNLEDLGVWCSDKYGEAGIYSPKMTEIIEILSNLKSTEKILIFSMYTSVLDLLADAIDERLPEFKYVQIDGDTKGDERQTLIDNFKTQSDTRLALFTYKVGGEGLTLTEAVHLIRIEPWWTPAVHQQAEARIWRIGQTQNVHIHEIIIQNSIEERIMEICKEKQELASFYLEGTTKKVGKTGLDKFTLGRMLGIRGGRP